MEIKNQDYSNQLQHFGVLGMKWGKHKNGYNSILNKTGRHIKTIGKGVIDAIETDNRFQIDGLIHPIHSTASAFKTIKKNPSVLLRSFNPLDPLIDYKKQVNADVASKVAKDKERKAIKKQAKAERKAIKKQAKAERKAERIAAQDAYDKEIEKIEKPYNAYETMSEKDIARAKKAEEKIIKEWDAINKRYEKKIGKK